MTFRGKLAGLIASVAATAALLSPGSPALAAIVKATPDPLPTFNGTVLATAYAGDTLYVGGDFTSVTAGGRTVTRNRLAAVNARTGALLGWAPAADSTVRAIAVSGRAVFVGGAFTSISGTGRDGLARLDAGNGAVHNSFKQSLTGMPYSLAVGNGRLYAGGTMTSLNGQAIHRLAAFDPNTGAPIAGWRPRADDTVESVVVSGRRIYVGGQFGSIGGGSGTRHLAALTTSGAVDTGFTSRASEVVHAVAVGASGIYAAMGGPGGRLGAFTTSGAGRWTLTMDGDAQAVAVLDKVVYIGGHYDNVCKSARTGDKGSCTDGNTRRIKLAAANEAGGALLPWAADGNGSSGVHTMAASNSLHKVVAGGAFTTIRGASRARLAQFG
ncbi:hypothetical protein Ais01nite_32390 [Asanoa ishikariensis]|uniref:Delta-60 repeat domain-containing protein n=1 Tax=Asanoa ishikariensis TaxID=137265 RepID=A0A1H3UW14_9ACTN|nr:hypothetical protein [Asanoa ishikariensis]GIF65204.1 hypothetical protein Ais01nite_32390 [Asanoa ishikariensis]SDZ66614.1 protein of unknown function [Asanoa ishikariensis]